MPHKSLWLAFLLGLATTVHAQTPQHTLMPVPAALQFKTGRLAVNEQFTIAVRGHNDARLQGGLERMLQRLGARTGLTFKRGLATDTAALVIACQGAGKTIPAVDEDESYSLEINDAQATLNAPTVVGVLRGVETFLQLLNGDKDGYFLPAVSIQDKPRFPWRGLLIDIGRHWQPMEVIKRNLDGMAAVKLNVLHLHITEDQGFRIESKRYPKLHTMGSDGDYYTQDQMRELIEYARQRGIRVVPEFDMPGHTTAWFAGHPELASKPGPYEIERTWGVMKPVMDPTNEQLYEVLDGFLGEMAALFPDAYMHIGGDEVEGQHWKENPKIQAFVQERGLQDNHGLQAYFNQRVARIVTNHSKQMIGWDEVVHPALPKNIVVQSWRGPQSLAAAARQGYTGILSNGYYIDLMYPARDHYLNDPLPADTTLSAAEQKLILGGEATMWGEWVSPETIDSRIWPRTAAIAERFWSPREVRDVDDMYRRLAVVRVQLEEFGLLHIRNPEMMFKRLIGTQYNGVIGFALKPVLDFLEPVKGYKRGRMHKFTQLSPLTRLADVALPDSTRARVFAKDIDDFIREGRTNRQRGQGTIFDEATKLGHLFAEWQAERGKLLTLSPILLEAQPLMQNLVEIGKVAQEAETALLTEKAITQVEVAEKLAILERTAQPYAAVEWMMIQPIKELVIAAGEQEKRATMASDEWLKYVKALAAPKKQ